MALRTDLDVLPGPEWTVDFTYRRPDEQTEEEYLAVTAAIEALVRVAVERRDAKAAGRFMAAYALTHQTVQWLWQDNTYWFDGERPAEQCRAFMVSGVRGRPRRLLRAEARGIVWALRWLHRAGALGDGREASRQAWLRSPEGQSRLQRIG
jgi:transposase-like protein